MENDLEEFRAQWKAEVDFAKTVQQVERISLSDEKSNVDRAKQLFIDGISFEKAGDMSKAVSAYRQACKLEPEIEKIMAPQFDENKIKKKKRFLNKYNLNQENQFERQLREKISQQGARFLPERGSLCLLEILPSEILTIIISKIIGKTNDLLTLERLSLVNSAFYLLTLDAELWKDIFARSTCSDLIPEKLSSWKSLFISTPHVLFHGYYSAKVSYIRHGETSFQDSNFMPWHTVTYFRILKLFPSGKINYAITSENPQNLADVIGMQDLPSHSISYGTWSIENDILYAELYRSCPKPKKKKKGNVRGRIEIGYEYGIKEKCFHMEFQIVPERNSRYGLILIKNHLTTVYFDESSSLTEFDVKNQQQYPPMRFFPLQQVELTD